MKRIIFIFLIAVMPGFAAYDRKLVHVLEQLRECTFALNAELPMVGGAAVGDGGSPHEFYLLLPYVFQVASDDDLRAMIQDPSPVVRIMAATCILKKEDKALIHELEPLTKDTAKVVAAPYGCIISQQTVAEVVGYLKKNPHYWEGGEAPNQPLQPTPSGRG